MTIMIRLTKVDYLKIIMKYRKLLTLVTQPLTLHHHLLVGQIIRLLLKTKTIFKLIQMKIMRDMKTISKLLTKIVMTWFVMTNLLKKKLI